MRGRVLWVLFVSGAMLLLATLAGGRGEAAVRGVRVALVGEETSSDALVAMVQGQLSGRSAAEFQLVDRQAIDRVLEEQKTALSGLVGAERAATAGRLLSADLFAVVQSGEEAGLVVFDGKTGARMIDVTLPKETEERVQAIGRGVEAAVRKLSGGTNRRVVCISAIRNANQPREMDSFCQSVGLLAERRLVNSEQVIVLERRRLDQINRERQLPTTRGASDLLASLCLVEVEVAKENGGLAATAVISEAQGAGLGKVSVKAEKAEAAELAGRLSGELATALNAAAPANGGDAAAEAVRFGREAEFLAAHQEYPESLRAAEAAYALNPSESRHEQMLVLALMRQAKNGLMPGRVNTGHYGTPPTLDVPADAMVASYAVARRAMEMRQATYANLGQPEWNVARKSAPAKTRQAWSLLYDDAKTTSAMRDVAFQSWDKAYADNPALQREKVAFRSGCGVVVKNLIDLWKSAVENKPNELFGFGNAWTWNGISKTSNLCAANAREAFEEQFALAQWYIEAARKQGMGDLTPKVGSLEWPRSEAGGREWDRDGLTAEDRQRIEAVRKQVETEGAVAKFVAASSRLKEAIRQKEGTESILKLYQEYKSTARAAAADPALLQLQGQTLLWRRARHYGECLRQIGSTPFAEGYPRYREYIEWLRFILSRREWSEGALDSALSDWPWHQRREEAADLVGVFRSAVAAFDDPQTLFLDESREAAWLHLAKHVHDFSGVLPELKELRATSDRVGVRPLWQAAERTSAVHELLGAVVIDGDQVYGAMMDRGTLQAIRVSLSGGGPAVLGKVDLKLEGDADAQGRHCLAGAFVGHGRLFVATRDAFNKSSGRGVFAFPLEGGAVERIDKSKGLPSDSVDSLAILGGKLYLGLGEGGYLVSYDLKSGACDVLAASRRIENRSPLDNLSTFTIPFLGADVARKRLVAYVNPGSIKGVATPDTLWTITPENGEFVQRVQLTAGQNLYNCALRDGKAVFGSYAWLFELDLQSDQVKVLYYNGNASRIGPKLRAGDEAFHPQMSGCIGPAMANGWLWMSFPLSRTPRDGGRPEFIAIEGMGPSSTLFRRLEPIPGGKSMLFANDVGIWVLTPKE